MQQSRLTKAKILRLDVLDSLFRAKFSLYESDFFNILSKSYKTYYGDSYHLERIIAGKAILYLFLVDNKTVGVSYVKRNLRRGAIAIYPEYYRRLGIARRLINNSLLDFPKQYSIISTDLSHSYKMISLFRKIGFKNPKGRLELQFVLGESYSQLYNFRLEQGLLLFNRRSLIRNTTRRNLTLFHTFPCHGTS